MIKFFSNLKIIFYFLNFCLIFVYLFPGSLPGLIFYGDKNIQPQITSDFIISSNHFYVFVMLSIVGFLTFIKSDQVKKLILYLILLSIILEIFHLFIPERSFQWQDLFGNLFGVIIVIFVRNLIKKHELFKK
jgi:VanZ family protein